jgi:hypothetical protein
MPKLLFFRLNKHETSIFRPLLRYLLQAPYLFVRVNSFGAGNRCQLGSTVQVFEDFREFGMGGDKRKSSPD